MNAPPNAVTFTVTWEASTYVTPVIVKPPEIATVTPDWKAVPVTVNDTVWLCATTSWAVAVGNVIVGAALTVKHAGQEPEPPSGFVTVTEREPVEAPDEIVTFVDNWVVLTNDQRFAFMTNTLSNTVSRFSIARNGKLTLLGNVPTGPGFASDEALSRNGKFLYVLLPSIMGGMSHIDFYKVGSGGSLTHLGETPSNLPPGASGLAAK